MEQKTTEPFYAHDRFDSILRRDYGKSLLEIGKTLGYSEENIDFLSVDELDIEACKSNSRKHKDIILGLEGDMFSKKRKGKRSWTNYIKTLISGWIGEDLFYLFLKKNGFDDIEFSGEDRKRKILIKNVSAKPDFVIGYAGNKRNVELIQEFTNITLDCGYIDFRESKILRCAGNLALVVFRMLESNKYIIIDFATDNAIVTRIFHEKWGKPVFRYFIDKNGKKILPFSNLVSELKFRLAQPITFKGQVIVEEENKQNDESEKEQNKVESETKQEEKIEEQEDNNEVAVEVDNSLDDWV